MFALTIPMGAAGAPAAMVWRRARGFGRVRSLGQLERAEMLRIVLLVVALLGVASVSRANPVTWDFQNAVFEDGGKVLGSFVYDADTALFSDVHITTTAGSDFQGATYAAFFSTLAYMCGTCFVPSAASDYTNAPLLQIGVDSPLTDAGGSSNLNFLGESLCENSSCTNTAPLRLGGTATEQAYLVSAPASTDVPEPASVLLLMTAVGGAGLSRRTSLPARCAAGAPMEDGLILTR